MSGRVIITGVPADPGSAQPVPYPRQDIRTLVKDDKQFSLFVQAVSAMQQMSESEVRSWYQVSGIHGLPYVSWDGAANPGNTQGYCEHGTLLFPTWHRPYVALYEQLLHDHALQIAEQYTVDKDAWKAAAFKLRSPYWDWASEAVPPDEVIKNENVQIILKDGKKGPFKNPLLGYTFKPGFPADTRLPDVAVINPSAPKRVMRPNTVRCAKPGSTVTDLPSLIASLSGQGPIQRGDWRDETFDTIIRAPTWSVMSNGTSRHGMTQGGDRAVNSLEAIHGNVHVVTGGNGHMSSVPVAGFDPIFWMHHSNVDRVLALWQAIHYDQFMDANLANKDLLPFWNGQQTFWHSTGARTLKPLNYTYPEFQGLNLDDKPAVKIAITNQVNKLYGPTDNELFQFAALSAANAPQGQAAAHPAQQPLQAAKTALGQAVAHAPTLVGGSAHIPPHTRRDWTVRVRSKLHQFGESYSVLIFVGDPPASEHDWRTSPNYVGAFCAFVNSSPEKCSNCREHAESVVEGFVPLNRHLCAGHVNALRPDTVVPYLKNRIHWRIQKTDASIVEAKDVAELEVAVMSVEMEYLPEERAYKTIANPSHHAEITNGRPGGRRL
ncbi:hypothetical protein FRB93_007678 [Tulasnella sp. JGI-2019a]|nr:hypothetical protein FRB93_007678 [Tulasnella sp. JGI-2019a]